MDENKNFSLAKGLVVAIKSNRKIPMVVTKLEQNGKEIRVAVAWLNSTNEFCTALLPPEVLVIYKE